MLAIDDPLAQLIPDFLKHLEDRVFPNFSLNKFSVIGVIFYGSRAAGFQREDSDLDATVIIETNQSNSEDLLLEYHGHFTSGSESIPLELRIFTQASYQKFLADGQLHNLTWARIVFDPDKVVCRSLEIARERWDKEFNALSVHASHLNFNQTIELLQIFMTEGKSICLHLLKSGSVVALWSRFSEILKEFYFYIELLEFAQSGDSLSEFSKMHLTFLISNRSAKYMDESRYPFATWYASVASELACCLQSLTRESLETAFAICDSAFEKKFKTKLLLQAVNQREVWVGEIKEGKAK